MCEDEIAVAKPQCWQNVCAALGSKPKLAFGDFDFPANPKLPGAILRDLAALGWLDTGDAVIL